MADIRIKDLTTTASSTASDDFIAVDGTTNGTRKLNAFSPTFGGNATVTGTLTANGTITANSTASGILVNGAGITMDTDPVGASASLRFVDGATPRFWIYKLSGDSNLYFRDMTNSRMQLQMLPGATSSNAISTFNSILNVTSTTASTTTSTGALVVSGGLGVAGAINAGGPITTGSDGSLVAIYVPGDSAVRAAAGKFYLDTRATDGGDIVLRPRINAALTLAAATGNATFGGNITTAAPSGGTAAAWKLGTVATVSPTSPNRTIEVDIGGTIYYIHAKTTNN